MGYVTKLGVLKDEPFTRHVIKGKEERKKERWS